MEGGVVYGGGSKMWWWWRGSSLGMVYYVEGRDRWVLGLASAH